MTRPLLLDKLRAVLQEIIDEDDRADGWTLSQLVIVMGIERIMADGSMEATSWYWRPPDQADWMTVGLLDAALDMHANADIED
jgi:hypothetical protein